MSHLLIIFLLLSPQKSNVTEESLAVDLVAKGLEQPLFLTSPPDDLERLFVLERPGRIRILKNGSLLEEPFLDIKRKITTRGEGGILGLAFHPNYKENGRFFINYTEKKNKGATIVAEWTVHPDNPDIANLDSGVEIIRIQQPWSNHNGGMVELCS
ncbi:MAG TPA: hypothetical protein DDW23_08635 [Planctomycetes bacterium]|nr:hypothetical protein [Planctomycetota bacterium]